MNYFAAKADHVVGIMVWTPKKEDGSRDTHSFTEICKCQGRGNAELICYLLNNNAYNVPDFHRNDDNSFIQKYVVLTVKEAKAYREAAK